MSTANKFGMKNIKKAFIEAFCAKKLDIKKYETKLENRNQRKAVLKPTAITGFALGMGAITFGLSQDLPKMSIDGQEQTHIAQTISQVDLMSDDDWNAIRAMSREIAKATEVLFIGESSAKAYLSMCVANSLSNQDDKRPIKEQLQELITSAKADNANLSTYIAAKCVSPNNWKGQYDKWLDLATRGFMQDAKAVNVIAIDAMSDYIEFTQSVGDSVRQNQLLLEYNNQVAERKKVSSSAYDWFSAASSLAAGVGSIIGSDTMQSASPAIRKMGNSTRSMQSRSRTIRNAPSGSARKWRNIGDAARSIARDLESYGSRNNYQRRLR